jgi:hypothetical protein
MARKKAGENDEEAKKHKSRKNLGVAGSGRVRKGDAESSKVRTANVGKRSKKLRIKAAKERRLIKPTVYWAVKCGRVPGVYTSLERYEQQVKGFQGAMAKKFKSEKLAKAFVADDGAPAAEVSNDYIAWLELVVCVRDSNSSMCSFMRLYSFLMCKLK